MCNWLVIVSGIQHWEVAASWWWEEEDQTRVWAQRKASWDSKEDVIFSFYIKYLILALLASSFLFLHWWVGLWLSWSNTVEFMDNPQNRSRNTLLDIVCPPGLVEVIKSAT